MPGLVKDTPEMQDHTPTDTSATDAAAIISSIPEDQPFPPLYRSHIHNCQFSAWHAQYRSLVPKARVLKPLPTEFIEYLLEDGIVVPPETFAARYTVDEHMDSETAYDEEEEEDEVVDPSMRFRDLHEKIEDVIKEFGGAVMPKLNWSAPKDATWISTTSSMKCVTPGDVYMLLKSSSYIVHDLTEAYSDCIDTPATTATTTDSEASASASAEEPKFELVLRQWAALNPALEFRCFVRSRHLLGVSQRDTTYFSFLAPLADTIAGAIEHFFETHLQDTFADPDFVFDVYVPRPYERVWLIDINPFAARTDSVFFAWPELLTFDFEDPEFEFEVRLQTSDNSSRNFGSLDHSENHVPKDVVDASMTGEGIAQLARQWQSMMALQHPDESDSDSDNS